MKQYEFEVRNKRTGAVDQVRATANNQITAYLAIKAGYGNQYEIGQWPLQVRPAHAVLGEIDCTGVASKCGGAA